MDIQFLSEYLEFLEVEKGLSNNTIDAYRNDLTSFFDYCQTRGVSEISRIDRADLNAFIMKLREDKYTPSSVMRKVASLRGFFKWFCANEYGKKNPAQTLEQPKLPKRLPKVMTIEELNSILNSNLSTLEQLIVELLYGCGLRVSELVNLKLNNVDVKQKYIQCFGKGSKERIVPFGNKAKDAINRGKGFYILDTEKNQCGWVNIPLFRQFYFFENVDEDNIKLIEENIKSPRKPVVELSFQSLDVERAHEIANIISDDCLRLNVVVST